MTGRARESQVPVPGARLFVREMGAGAPLLVLHGGPDFDHFYLLPEMDGLSSGVRLIYYDQRGRGRSSAGVAPEDVTIDSEVEDLDALRRHFGLEQIALMGHSWGGILAAEYATRHPHRISHLVFLNTAPLSCADRLIFRERRERTEAETLARMRAIAATPEYASGDAQIEADYYRLHYGSTLRRPEHLDKLLRRLRSHFTTEGILKARAIEERLYRQTWVRPEYDLVPMLADSAPLTLVIHGRHDFVPLECSENIASGLHGASLAVFEDCGHFSYMERPADVFEAILSHLSRSRGSS